jgi:prepilin-type N-terminal cleavage/methylation domain-containing protein
MSLEVATRMQKQKGFTIAEVMVAMVVLMVSLVGIAQLVPFAIRTNTAARADSTAVVFAERELDEMVEQPFTTFTFTDMHGNINCTLGNSATPNQWVGSPTLTDGSSRTLIDFSQGTVAGYNFTYADPSNPNQRTYDVRWAVYTWVNSGSVTGRRIVIGARLTGGNAPFLPISLDTMVQR